MAKGLPRSLKHASAKPGKAGVAKQMPYQAPAAAADTAALKTQFDALLTKLVEAGLMEPDDGINTET
jgi:hypothetical protein